MCTAGTLVAALDAVVYVIFPVAAGRLLRLIEGRPMFHRFGKRTIIVADVPWVCLCEREEAQKDKTR